MTDFYVIRLNSDIKLGNCLKDFETREQEALVLCAYIVKLKCSLWIQFQRSAMGAEHNFEYQVGMSHSSFCLTCFSFPLTSPCPSLFLLFPSLCLRRCTFISSNWFVAPRVIKYQKSITVLSFLFPPVCRCFPLIHCLLSSLNTFPLWRATHRDYLGYLKLEGINKCLGSSFCVIFIKPVPDDITDAAADIMLCLPDDVQLHRFSSLARLHHIQLHTDGDET